MLTVNLTILHTFSFAFQGLNAGQGNQTDGPTEDQTSVDVHVKTVSQDIIQSELTTSHTDDVSLSSMLINIILTG